MNKQVKRHQPTAEEKAEAARLRAAWEAYKDEHPGASQEWLGRTAGIGGQSAVSQYLRGDLALNFANLVKFASVLKFELSDISPRLVAEHMDVPAAQNREPANPSNRSQNTPLSSEARELIQCVGRLDRRIVDVQKTFKLLTGLLLLTASRHETDDMKTAEELVTEAEELATEILAEPTGTRPADATNHRKSR